MIAEGIVAVAVRTCHIELTSKEIIELSVFKSTGILIMVDIEITT